MKKVFALLMVLVLACALCVPALATNEKTYNKSQLQALAGKVPDALKDAYNAVVDKVSGNVVVDVDVVKAARTKVENAMANETNPATLQATLTQAANELIGAIKSGLTISNPKVTVNALTGAVTVTADVQVQGQDAPISVSANATAAKAKNEQSGSSGSSGSSDTTSNTAAAASSVIKATGFDTTAVVMVVLAIAGVLGVATVKARKLD